MRTWELFEPRLIGIECYDNAAAVAAGRRQVEGPGCVQWGGVPAAMGGGGQYSKWLLLIQQLALVGRFR